MWLDRKENLFLGVAVTFACTVFLCFVPECSSLRFQSLMSALCSHCPSDAADWKDYAALTNDIELKNKRGF